MRHTLILLIIVASLALTRCTSDTKQAPQIQSPARAEPKAEPRPEPRAGDFAKKQVCAAKLEKLQEAETLNAFSMTAHYRTFYSPLRDSCIEERYTLYYPHGKVDESETLEVEDLSNNETLWIYRVPCEVRETGNPEKPVRKRTCADYAWIVEGQLDDYVKENKLE